MLANVILTEEEVQEAIHQAKLTKYWRLHDERVQQMREAVVTEVKRSWNWKEQYKYLFVRAVELGIPDSVVNRIIAQNPDMVDALCMYFTKDRAFEDFRDGLNQPYQLHKGIWLQGDPGTGKTTLMKLFARNKRQCFDMVTCLNLQNLFMQDGDVAIETLSKNRREPKDMRWFFHETIGKWYEDLGTEEPTVNRYGTKRNVMAEVFQNRYAWRHEISFDQTHITTNKSMGYVNDNYGTRVLDRIKDMFNVIELKGGSLRG